MATTPSIADQLRAYQESLEYANRTAEAIKDQRNLLKEVVNQARLIGVEFNKHTENIGESVKEIKLFESTEAALQNVLRDRNTIESSLLKQLKNRSDTQQNLDLAQRVSNTLTRASAIDEINQKTRLIGMQIKAGVISREDGLRQINFLSKIKNNTGQMITNLQKQTGYQDAYIARTRDNLRLENVALDKLKMKNGFMQLGKKLLGDMGPLGEKIINIKSFTAWQFFVDILEKGYENFKAFDKASVDVRKNIGALPGQATVLENRLKTVTIDMMHLGATFDDVAKSINEITNEFTGLVAQDENLLKTTTALAKQFGIAEGTSVKFLKTLGGISGNSASSQKSMIGFAQKMAQASGVPLGKIMEDVANASDDVRVYVGSSAVSMIKAATAARMMGIDLNKAASSAEKLLQFESSISSELKASALLGQNINFNYARQLSFNKDIIGANKEILKITKQVNFNQLNPIQQKAFADAAGKSVSELQDMLTQEKNIQLVRNGTNEKAKKALADYERMMQLKDEEAKNEGKVAEQQILQRANQEKLAQIQNRFNQLMSELAEPVMEIADVLLDIATTIMPSVISFIKLGIVAFKPLVPIIGWIATKLSSWVATTSAFIGPLSRTSGILLSIGKFLLPIAGFFGKWLNPIGWIITAFITIKNYIRDVKRMFEEGGSWGSMIAKGLLLIPKAIIEAFLPFDIVKKTLDEWFFGKSPSKAGKLIAKGFSSIGPELQASLTSPINSAYKDIENMSPPEVSIETKNPAGLNANIDSTLVGTIQSGNQQLVAKIDQLINMMANGGIAVNLDGQKINAALSTTMLKSGGFGQATTRA